MANGKIFAEGESLFRLGSSLEAWGRPPFRVEDLPFRACAPQNRMILAFDGESRILCPASRPGSGVRDDMVITDPGGTSKLYEVLLAKLVRQNGVMRIPFFLAGRLRTEKYAPRLLRSQRGIREASL